MSKNYKKMEQENKIKSNDSITKTDIIVEFAKEEGKEIIWGSWPGEHDWVFWQACIVKFLAWLPL